MVSDVAGQFPVNYCSLQIVWKVGIDYVDSNFGDCCQYPGGANHRIVWLGRYLGKYCLCFLLPGYRYSIRKLREGRRQKAVWIGFFSLIAMTLLMNMALYFSPLAGDEFALNTHESLTSIFKLMPRIAVASLAAYLVSQQHDIWAFHFWKKRFPTSGQLWLRNNLSTMISQLLDSVVFTFVAFWGVFEWPVLWEILVTTYVLKWAVAAADTPFVYWSRIIHKKGNFILK